MANERRLGQDPAESQVQRLAILGELLAIMAHEINNLMVGVLGYADLELAKERDPESAENLRRISTCGSAIRELTRNLLQFARPGEPKAGGWVQEAVSATVDLFRRKLREVELVCAVPQDLPMVALPTSDLRLILANLVKNALEAMEESETREIRITGWRDSETVHLSLWNSGPPIPEQEISQLFQPFFTTKGDGEGTGLGLSIAKRLIVHAGGNLSARNPKSGGVSFELGIPFSVDSGIQEAVVVPSGMPRLDGRRILVVDDENSVREVTRLMVSRMGGADVDTCASGEEALKLLENQEFDAIVLDLRMAGLSGEDVYRSLPAALQRRVVFVTGDSLGSSTASFLADTKQPALFKPIGWRELLNAVQEVAAAAH